MVISVIKYQNRHFYPNISQKPSKFPEPKKFDVEIIRLSQCRNITKFNPEFRRIVNFLFGYQKMTFY